MQENQLYAQGSACGMQSAGLEPQKHPTFTQLTPDHEDYEDQYITNLRHGSVAGFKYFDLQATKAIALKVRGDAGTVHIFDRIGGTAHSGLFFQVETGGAVDFFQFTLK